MDERGDGGRDGGEGTAAGMEGTVVEWMEGNGGNRIKNHEITGPKL